MPSSADPAVLRALSIDSASNVSRQGGSGFTSAFRLSTPTTCFFVKTSSAPGAAVMFEGEHASLNAIHGAVPSLCPQSFACGKLDGGNGYFLATEFLDLHSAGAANQLPRGKRSGNSDSKSSQTKTMRNLSLAQKLARLHSTPAPIPKGHDTPQYGFPVTTCCGDTPQDNGYRPVWADFFAHNRLLAVLGRGEARNGRDPELRRAVERTVREVVPRLLGEGHLGGQRGIVPVVVHGDLWSGNKSKGRFVGRGQNDDDDNDRMQDVIFDPSACYAHNEYDFGIMNMFGGFGTSFWDEYHSLVPKTEPQDEYGDRVALYESYHHLNHWAIFGGGYKDGAMAIFKRLLKKYGDK